MSELPRIRVRAIDFSVLPTVTRFPFRYGIAAMTEAPHLFVRSDLEIDGRPAVGLASEGLPPKWFTKNPQTTFEDDDLPEMMRVIRHAADRAQAIGEPLSFFEFWVTLTQQQESWASAGSIPPLLAQLGTAMMERTVLDGLCRHLKRPLHTVVGDNLLGIRLADVHAELKDVEVAERFRHPPLGTIRIRHTVGLADPLTDADIAPPDRIDDGLPHSLLSNIQTYGLTRFKLKLSGDLESDRDRLRDLTALLESAAPAEYRITIDGNEQYASIESFRDHFLAHRADPKIAPMLNHLLFVEQPVHRDVALADSVKGEFDDWPDAPAVIIDESDAGVDDLPRALELGYTGTSHKNCKGVLKSIANRVLIDVRGGVMSAEDLAGLGPVAMLQDLAVVALLGIDHAERNGHHYFAGLSMFPEFVQQRVLETHSDLYDIGGRGFPALRIEAGQVATLSLNRAPFGNRLDVKDFRDVFNPY